ncbi:MAG: 4Fe-4S binding protein [Lactobacillales bacterium]|jgi:ferredoxin|nr:4Fe-4S binding protein [Lactobacillales bacterium]
MAYRVVGDCIGCGACVDNCPVSCIEMVDGIAVIDEDACISCGTCEGNCPVSAIEEV